ncbi:MAG: polymer-forming cytoskeletal protein [Candidatus Zixiibacteriota bacterium]
MKRMPCIILVALFFCLLCCSLSAQRAQQPDFFDSLEQAQDLPVFSEIILTDKGVVAVDTDGFDWYYDFEQDRFVQGSMAPDDEVVGIGRNQDWDFESVEERCTELRQVEQWGTRAITVGYDEVVRGDITTRGRVTIKGWVTGNVKSLYKRVIVVSTGRVDGNVMAPKVVVRDGGRVLGRIERIETPIDFDDFNPASSVDGVVAMSVLTVFLLLCGFIVVSFMPKQLQAVADCERRYPARSFFIGLLWLFGLPLVIVLVVITIVGIMIVPFIPVAYVFAVILGVISFGCRIGRITEQRLASNAWSPMLQTTVGVALFMSLWIITAALLGSADSVSNGLGIAFLVLSIVVSCYPLCVGIGVAVLTRFGYREYVAWRDKEAEKGKMPAPAPPPIPPMPPGTTPLSPSSGSGETPGG